MEARWRKEGNWDGNLEGSDAQPPFWKRKKWWIILGVFVVIFAIVIPVAVVMSKKHDDNDNNKSTSSGEDDDSPYTSSLNGLSHDSIPVCLFPCPFSFIMLIYVIRHMPEDRCWIPGHGTTRGIST
jgi:hypothetical protein